MSAAEDYQSNLELGELSHDELNLPKTVPFGQLAENGINLKLGKTKFEVKRVNAADFSHHTPPTLELIEGESISALLASSNKENSVDLVFRDGDLKLLPITGLVELVNETGELLPIGNEGYKLPFDKEVIIKLGGEEQVIRPNSIIEVVKTTPNGALEIDQSVPLNGKDQISLILKDDYHNAVELLVTEDEIEFNLMHGAAEIRDISETVIDQVLPTIEEPTIVVSEPELVNPTRVAIPTMESKLEDQALAIIGSMRDLGRNFGQNMSLSGKIETINNWAGTIAYLPTEEAQLDYIKKITTKPNSAPNKLRELLTDFKDHWNLVKNENREDMFRKEEEANKRAIQIQISAFGLDRLTANIKIARLGRLGLFDEEQYGVNNIPVKKLNNLAKELELPLIKERNFVSRFLTGLFASSKLKAEETQKAKLGELYFTLQDYYAKD